ncbi:MAG: peptidyl-prolyl cis-trans isomerase [Verrucomicrobiota bacterium]
MMTVNGESIDPALVDEAFMRIKAKAESESEGSCCERDDEFREAARDEVINGILLSQEAERRVPAPGKDEVREQLEQTLRKWREHGASWDLLEAQRDQLRAELVAKLRMDRFVDEIWSGLPELGDDDLRTWHEKNADTFRRPTRAKVLHMVRFPEEAQPATDYRLLLDLRKRILNGEDFAKLAKEHTRKADGEIDLGWIEHERVLNTFETMLFSLGEKEVSPVFFYEQALHLVWPEEVEPEHVAPFEEVTDEVRELALAEQRREALQQLAAELRKTAEINEAVEA